MQLNKDYFKRESTWMNIAEVVVATGVQLAVDMPTELSMPIWGYVSLRLVMAVIQAVKRDAGKV